MQAKGGFDDYAERAKGADEELGQVVSGDVLDDFSPAARQRAIRQSDRDADEQVAQRAVYETQWTGVVGGENATNDSVSCLGSLRDLLIGITIALPARYSTQRGKSASRTSPDTTCPSSSSAPLARSGVIVEATLPPAVVASSDAICTRKTSVAQLRRCSRQLTNRSLIAVGIRLSNMIHLLIRIEALAGAIQSKCDQHSRKQLRQAGKCINTTSDA